MSKNTSVALGEHFEEFVDKCIHQGRYKNASEVIRAGLRLLEDYESKIIILKKAIQEGRKDEIASVIIESGINSKRNFRNLYARVSNSLNPPRFSNQHQN